ncbi:hypothetical protein CQ10_31110 [Bradyrhizobium valentinum]|nr:hypothetical protein CQ10_31110 [Bradyrhizobium valentinum]
MRDYITNGGGPRSVVSSVNKLLPGTLPTLDDLLGRAPRALDPYPLDARLINEALWHAARDVGASTGEQRRPIHMRATRLRALSDWLKKENRGSSLAGSTAVSGTSTRFRKTLRCSGDRGRNRTLMDGDLAILRNYLQTVDADQALGLQGREQSGLPQWRAIRTLLSGLRCQTSMAVLSHWFT